MTKLEYSKMILLPPTKLSNYMKFCISKKEKKKRNILHERLPPCLVFLLLIIFIDRNDITPAKIFSITVV